MARTIAKDYDQKRGRILKTAARVFARDGCTRASMSQLAAACGISKANIYHYYDSKEALLYDILDTYLSSLRDRLAALEIEGLPPAGKLRAILEDILLAYEGMDHEHQIQTEGIAALPPEKQEVLRDYQRDMVKLLSGIIEENAPGAFDGDPSKLQAATMSVFGMLNWFYMWNRSADAEARRSYAALVAHLTLEGLPGLGALDFRR